MTFSSIIFLLLLETFLLFFPSNSSSVVLEEPPRFVYRADFRDPQTVFKTGFEAAGNNDNLLEHVKGISCFAGPEKNSAFVATTSVERFARDWGGDFLWAGVDDRRFTYIYKIRATGNFYSSFNSLMRFYKKTKNKHYKQTAMQFQNEHEWVAYQGIPKELIQSVLTFERARVPAKLSLYNTQINPDYISAVTEGNEKPFPIRDEEVTSRVSLIASVIPKLSSCFGSCLKAPQSRSRAMSVKGSCSKSFQTSFKAEKGTIWDPVLNGPKERLVPWKEEEKREGNHFIEKPAECTIDTNSANMIRSVLKINCPQNRFYQRFCVILIGRRDGRILFYTKHVEGETGRTWTKSARQIRMLHNNQDLATNGHTINEVFWGVGDKQWHSEIRVLPVYPTYHRYRRSSNVAN